MINHYLRLAFRHARRHTAYIFINIAGLAVGMACFLLILLHVWDELSYDRYHENANRIYRVALEQPAEGRRMASVPAPLGPAIVDELPEVRHAVRFKAPTYKWMLQYEDNAFNERRFLVTDPEIFDVFSWSLARGNPDEALTIPNGLVITAAMAKKYFGDEEPIGKIIRAENWMDFQVTGIIDPPPSYSHFTFDFLASFRMYPTYQPYGPELMQDWAWPSVYTYLLLEPNADPHAVARKLAVVLEKYQGAAYRDQNRLALQPLTDIHLYSDLEGELGVNSDIDYIYLFSAIACLILLIGCINFMNLATARATTRATEVGMRKVVGASRMQLMGQFLGESVLTAALALPLAMALIVLLLPSFNVLVGKDLGFGTHPTWWFWPGVLAMTLLVGFVSGSYPAFFLSAFQPAGVLKGAEKSGSSSASGRLLRRLLVVVQFTISIVLIVCTVMIDAQLDYVRQKHPGFDRDQVLYTRLTFNPQFQRLPALKQALRFSWRQAHWSWPSPF